MDTQKEFSNLEKSCKIYSKAVDVEGEYQETLPAYLDDVYRVVKCVSHSFVTSADISFNEVKVYGKTLIQITYYNENSELCFADFEEEFSKVLTIDNMTDLSFVRAVIADKYTNFRVINQRRIDIHTMSVLHISVYDRESCPTICSCENSKLKSEEVTSCDVFATHIDKIEFDEEVTLPADSRAIGRIISTSSYPTVTETRIIKDKILVKVNLNTEILYTSDSDDEAIEKAQYSFQLSKIIDKSGINDGDVVIADADIGSVFVKVKGAANEKISLINIFGDVILNLVFIRENTMSVVTDGYTLGAQSDAKYTDVSASVNGKYINEHRLVNVPIEFNGEVTEIKELSLSLSAPVLRDSVIQTTVNATGVVNTDSGLASVNATADIEIPIEHCDDAIVSLGIDSFDYTLSSGGRVDVRLNINLCAYCYNDEKISVLSDLIAGEPAENNHSLVVYFGKENETVWDIAKAFLSDEELIIKENSLKNSTLDSPGVLIIPRA